MALRLILETDPPIELRDGGPPSLDLSWPRLHSVGPIRQSLRVGGGETPNTTAEIDNGDGRLTAWLADSLRSSARIERDGSILLDGLVREVRIGATARLTIEAGA